MPLSHKKRTKLGIIGLYTMFTAALVGSLCGTFAWYTYGARASLLYEGSSIGGGSDKVQLGLVCDGYIEDEDCEVYKLERENYSGGRYIYWSTSESLDGLVLNKIMELNGYAFEGMRATTAEKRELGYTEPVVLKSNPVKGRKYESSSGLAPKVNYAYFEFASRKIDAEDPSKYESHSVSLKSFSVDSETNIKKGLRLVFTNWNNTEYYLVNPTEKDNGYDIAAGPLDLNADSYYDIYQIYKDGHYVQGEFPYGNFKELYYKDEPESESGHAAKDECGTFNANHMKNTYAIDMERSVPEVIEYYGVNDFNTIPLVVGESNPGWRNYAFFDITLYLEGWDLATDNVEAFKNFTFLLEFDI